jgi:alpha-tubulin suppressor-like RCC1 family protein
MDGRLRFPLAVLVLGFAACNGGGSDGGSDPNPSAPAAVDSVTVAPDSLMLTVGDTQQLTATLKDQAGNTLTGRTITWSTSDDTVAAVSTTGIVTANAAGSATITATSEGKSGDSAITVVTGASVAYTAVVTGGAHSCALTENGSAYCWGRGESGQLGVSPPSTSCVLDDGNSWACSLVPVAVSGGRAFESLTGGGSHTCALTEDGSAYCWGSNDRGQLGDGSSEPHNTPTPVAGGSSFASIDAGESHTCALTNGGVAHCWGANDRGQLGDGSTTDRLTPVVVAGAHSFESITAGGFGIGQTCGIVSGGAAYCWGDNERGQLGSGTADLGSHATPAKVSGTLSFDRLSTGLGRHTCGITAAGAGYCWGENSFGALGDGTQADSVTPVAVHGALDFVQIVAGGYIGHTCGRSNDGTAYCWGDNEVGAVGDGTTTDRLEPAAVASGLSFTSIDAGYRHTCGVASTGIVYCWGRGAAGQLGNNSKQQSEVPVEVAGQ